MGGFLAEELQIFLVLRKAFKFLGILVLGNILLNLWLIVLVNITFEFKTWRGLFGFGGT